MLERFIIVIALAAIVVVASLVTRARARRRVAQASRTPAPGALLARLALTSPTIVEFCGPRCPSCRQQEAVLERLTQKLAARVVKIDATQEPELADALAVSTVPSTVLIDRDRTVRAINLGFRGEAVLAAQLRDLIGTPSGPIAPPSATGSAFQGA